VVDRLLDPQSPLLSGIPGLRVTKCRPCSGFPCGTGLVLQIRMDNCAIVIEGALVETSLNPGLVYHRANDSSRIDSVLNALAHLLGNERLVLRIGLQPVRPCTFANSRQAGLA
jgi:hypothetical protein